jgi:2,4-dienoyl-CoA reductase-like NADH-dependent reductase (Old Yellow Enzyme family)
MSSARLREPLTLRAGVTLKNRLALAPLTNTQSADDGTLRETEARWLGRRARGGFGLVETCAAFIDSGGKGFDGQLGVHDDVHAEATAALAADIAATGACGIVQLVHGGARSPSRLTGQQPVAPSVFVEDSPGFEPPRSLATDEILALRDAFIAAAVRVQQAGFAGVELHAAHGYLLSQFLSRTMNTRSDGWGGELEGRLRLLVEVARGVREACGRGFVVGVRLSPEERGFAKGIDLDDSLEAARRVADDDSGAVDFVHISLWDGRAMTKKRPDQHPARLFRDALPTTTALIAAGGAWTADDALALMAQGADVVAVGRAAILDPDWVKHVVIEGRAPVRGPRTAAELEAVDVSPGFVSYLRRFPGLVGDG